MVSLTSAITQPTVHFRPYSWADMTSTGGEIALHLQYNDNYNPTNSSNIVNLNRTTATNTAITAHTVWINGVQYDPDALGTYYIEIAREVVLKDLMVSDMRAKMRNHAIIIKGRNSRRVALKMDPASQEIRARTTLREMIIESEYRRYITNGFIMIRAKSGLWYQIFSGATGERVRTYKDGKPFESLCIHTDRSCPPTDHVINMKILVEIDEDSLRKGANIARLSPVSSPPTSNVPAPNLLQTYLALKKTG